MSDYISREAAIEAVREELGCETCNGSNVGIICAFCNVGEAILMIKNIPAADVEPVQRWIPCGRNAHYLKTSRTSTRAGKARKSPERPRQRNVECRCPVSGAALRFTAGRRQTGG